MRYAVYKTWKLNGFANLEAKEGSRFIPFDGKPKENNWRPNPMWIPHPDRKPWDIFEIEGLSALVLTKHAQEILQPIFDAGRYELLPLIHDGTEYTVVNILEVTDCLDRDKCVFDSFGIVQKYAFIPERITHSLFKIPEAVTGSFLVVSDADRPEWGFKHLVEQHHLQGLEFRLQWDGERPELSVADHAKARSMGSLETPKGLEVISVAPSAVVLRWTKVPGVDLYQIQWSKNGSDFYILDAIDAQKAQIASHPDSGTFCGYVDRLPTGGRTFYRVVGMHGKARSAPSVAVGVTLDRGDGDVSSAPLAGV